MNTELATIIIITSLIVYVIIDFGFVRRQVKLASNLVLSLGILGTFIGISIALFFFNTETDIQKSIAYFINSLRLAFITSVIGITANLFIRIFIKIPKVDDSGDLYYYQLAFLEKIYRRIDDAHTMMMPNTGVIVAPTQEIGLLEELQKINANLLSLSNAPSMKQNNFVTESLGNSINNLIEEHLNYSFGELRRDLSAIRTILQSYPEELKEFQASLRTVTREISNYNTQLLTLDEQMTQNKAGVNQLAETFEKLNVGTNQFVLMQEKIDSFFVTMNEVVTNIDNRESVKDIAFLRKQYTTEVQSRLGGMEKILERINKVLKLSSTTKTNDYV